MSGAPPALDLSACEREPIHLIPHVQPHGVLVSLDPQSYAVLQVSESVQAHFGIAPERLLRDGLGALLDAPAIARLRERVATEPLERVPVHLLLAIRSPRGLGAWDILAHRHDCALLLEIEPFAHAGPRPPDFYPLLRRSLPRLGEAPTLGAFCQGVTEEIRDISAYDRVMIYRFLEDGSGEVIAESRADEMPPYLGLRYPASDVPRPVRELYFQNPVRVIADVAYTPALLVPEHNPCTGRPLDLSYAHLRGVSATHLEYLTNMGVRAAMSLSIIRGGELWGLIACHHRARWILSYEARAACEVVASIVAAQLAEKEAADDAAVRARMEAVGDALAARLAGGSALLPALAEGDPALTALFPCGGAAVLSRGRCERFGVTPPEPELRDLARFLACRCSCDGVIAESALAEIYPPAAALQDTAAGVLALPVDPLGEECLLWLRPEVVQTVRWAGDPRRPAEPSPEGERLSPRRSFELWKELVRGRAEPFRAGEIAAARRLRPALTAMIVRRSAELGALNEQLARRNAELEAEVQLISRKSRSGSSR